jgi:epoxyqueuosine reductase QueG
MDESLGKSVTDRIRESVDAVGFAPVERFAAAPREHHPSAICGGAGTVIVYGTAVPRGVLDSPGYCLHLLQRSYHTAYPHLDRVGLLLANFLEKEGHRAVVVPSYAPLVFRGLEPWGILSLKHAAEMAGLGAFGRSGLLYHPRYGALLRLGAVVTTASLPGDPLVEEDPCPPGCEACRDSCPANAFQGGSFQKLACLGHSIKHGIYRHVLADEHGRENLEMVINTTGYNYWIDCAECLKACPLNSM